MIPLGSDDKEQQPALLGFASFPFAAAAKSAPLQFTNTPPQGKRYILLRLLIVVFAAVFIIMAADFKTFLLVLGISVLFVIAVSALVSRFIG